MYHCLVMADPKPAALQTTAAVPFAGSFERVRSFVKLTGLPAVGTLAYTQAANG